MGYPYLMNFWPEEEVNAWKEAVWKTEKEEALKLENTSEHESSKEDDTFISTMNISKDLFSSKLKDWTDGDPF